MATFDQEFLDRVREQTSLVDVVSRHVSLKRAGREFIGLSPFKSERTPSFTVAPDKGFFHCFSTGEHGDVIGFVMRMEGLSFPQAVEKLAEAAGIEMPRSDPQAERLAREANELRAALEAAAAWHERLLHEPEGAQGLAYLRGRGLSDEIIARFRLGWAPQAGGALARALEPKGFDTGVLSRAGLLRQGRDGDAYAMLRGRVVFPIQDRRQRVIAFGGRILESGQPKYLNTPETAVFQKRITVFGLPQALESARKSQEMVVVEGYMDVIALAQAGFNRAVAGLGTAIGEGHLNVLWTIVNEPVICLDGDEAGRLAARRLAERALGAVRAGKSARFARLPEGADPDDLVREKGLEAFQAVIDGAENLVGALWRSEIETTAPQSASAQAGCLRTLLTLCKRIRDNEVRLFHEAEIRAGCEREFGLRLPASFPRPASRAPGEGSRPRGAPPLPLGHMRRICGVLSGVLEFPELAQEFVEGIGMLSCPDPRWQGLLEAVVEMSADMESVEPQAWRQGLIERGHAEGLAFLEEERHRARHLLVSGGDRGRVSASVERMIEAEMRWERTRRRDNIAGPDDARQRKKDQEVIRETAAMRPGLRPVSEFWQNEKRF